jgi:hypothetical protein
MLGKARRADRIKALSYLIIEKSVIPLQAPGKPFRQLSPGSRPKLWALIP